MEVKEPNVQSALFQTAHGEGMDLRVQITSLHQFVNERVFFDHLMGVCSQKLAESFAANLPSDMLEDLKKQVLVKLVDKITVEMFPEIVKKIDADVLAKMVAISASRELRKEIV